MREARLGRMAEGEGAQVLKGTPGLTASLRRVLL